MAENTSEKGLVAKLGDRHAAPSWGLTEMGLAIGVLFIGVMIIGASVTGLLATSALNPDPISLVMGWLMGLVVVFVFVAVRWRRTKERFDTLQLQWGHWHPLLALMVGISGAFTASVFAGLGSGQFIAPMQVFGIESNSPGTLLLVGLFVIIAQPITENLIFSGITLPRLSASFGGWLGLLATIALYTLYYYLVYGLRGNGNMIFWYGIIYPLIIAFTISAVRIWSKSTLMSILAQIGIGISILFIMLVT